MATCELTYVCATEIDVAQNSENLGVWSFQFGDLSNMPSLQTEFSYLDVIFFGGYVVKHLRIGFFRLGIRKKQDLSQR